MAGYGSKLLEINWNGLKWAEMAPNGDVNDDGNDNDDDDNQSNKMAL